MKPRSTAKRLLLLMVTGLAALVWTNCAHGQEGNVSTISKISPDPGGLTLKTERVVVFKDGYGLFIKSATGKADAQGRVYTDQVPEGAVLGSFWAQAKKQPIRAMSAEWVERQAERKRTTAAVSMLELLRANQGQRVTLTLEGESRLNVSGNLVEVLDLVPDEEAIKKFPRNVGEDGLVREIVPVGGQLLVLDTQDGRMVLPVSDVRNLIGPKITTRIERREAVYTRHKRLSFDLGKKAAGKKVNIQLLYFSEGVRWIPTYQVSGDMKKKVGLDLQGELLNEIEDIEDAEISLVVGVPNFRFKTVVSPLALEHTMRNTLAEAAPSIMGNGMRNDLSNALFTQRSGEYRGAAPSSIANTGSNALLAADLNTKGSQDLFVYSVGRRSLPKGSRATAPLWQTKAPLRHVYTFDLKIRREGRTGRYTDPQGSPLKLGRNQIWHQLEITNDGDVPWTTGAAMILQDTLPLGQELLTYTPPGGCLFLPVTIAVDVRGDYEEEELDRKNRAMRRNNHDYTLVTKRGTITLTNYRKEATLMRVAMSVGGKASKASEGGKIKVDDAHPSDWDNYNYGAVNNHSDIAWEITLKPGERRTFTTTFQYYAW